MFDRFSNRLMLEGWLVTDTALRVGTGRATEPVGTDLPVMRDELGRPFIPGSSFKGALRARAESYVRAVVPSHRHGACLPTGPDRERCISNLEMAQTRQRAAREKWGDEQVAAWVWDHSCLACRTFGSPWLASHVQVKDLAVDKQRWFGQFQLRDGVAIDRDTETVAGAQLYNYEVVPAGTRFKCQLIAENADDWQLGWLWLTLQPFMDEKQGMNLGGFRSRGLGWVRFAEGDPKLYYFSLSDQVEDPVGGLIDYLTRDTPGGVAISPKEVEERKWVDMFKDELKRARRLAEAEQEANHA